MVTPAAAGPPPEHRAPDRFYARDGVRLRFRDEGRGTPVMLLHGWTLDLDMWDPQVEAWCDHFRLVRFDRRGFGLSSGDPAPARDLADLDALRLHLELGPVAVVGMSQGARAAVEFALAYPEAVACLVLDGPPHLTKAASEDDVPFAHYQAIARAQGLVAFQNTWARHPLLELRSRDASARRLLARMLARYPGRDLLQEVAPSDAAAVPRFEALATPTLLVTGEHDQPARVREADELARQIPYAERAVIRHAGHLPNLDNPLVYNARVRAFFDRHLRLRS